MLERFFCAKTSGFTAVEIQFPYQYSLDELQAAQQENALKIPLINLPAGDLMEGGLGIACAVNKQDEIQYGVEKAIEYGLKLNVEAINILSGKYPEDEERNRYYDIFLSNLDYCADQLNSVGIRPVFEAINTEDMPNFLIHSFAHMQQVLGDLNRDDVFMQYDIYHMHKMSEPIEQQLSESLQQIGHIQFADNPGRHEPGTGVIELEKLLGQLSHTDYCHWVSAEYNPSQHTEKSLMWMDWSVFKNMP